MLNTYGTSPMRGFGMARCAEAMLRAVGATAVHVVREAQLTGTMQQRQLGLSQPQYDDIAVGPAVIEVENDAAGLRKARLILPSKVVQKHAEAEGVETAIAWLLGARGIQFEGTLLRITKVKAELFAGVEYLYQVEAEG